MYFALVLVCAALQLAPVTPPKPAERTPLRPNFVFILGEGQGWSSTSVDMDAREPSTARPAGLTPNLGTLAGRGMRFSDFYAMAPRCTPSRASFFTGIGPAKLHMTYVNESGANKRDERAGEPSAPPRVLPPSPRNELPPGVKTTGDVLRAAGYATAHFGKWHVGRIDPAQHGFDVSDGANSNQGPERGEVPNPKQSVAITNRGIEFVRAQVQAKKPFFVQMSHYAVGSEAEVTPESLAATRELMPELRGKALVYAAGMRDMDVAIGRVLAVLRELGVESSTYVFVSTDHGTPGGAGGGRQAALANPPFSGGKGSVREGGVRVPFLVAGPGIEPGSVCSVRAGGIDLLPTLLELAGAPLAKPEQPDDPLAVEGASLVSVLQHGGTGAIARPREEFVIHYPHEDLGNGGPASAVYLGSWKLVRNYETQQVMLYDLAHDPAEAADLAAREPERVKALTARLDAYLAAVRAQMPRPNDGSAAPRDDGETRKGRARGKDEERGREGTRSLVPEEHAQTGDDCDDE